MTDYEKLFGNMFYDEIYNKVSTRSSKLIEPLHSAIANDIEAKGYKTHSIRNKEYEFCGEYGNKKIDIAIFDNDDNLVGAIFFKAIRNSYNKNANNYLEASVGESIKLTMSNIPVFELLFIPTQIRNGKKFETPSQTSQNNYEIYSAHSPLPQVKYSAFYFDIDYDNCKASYNHCSGKENNVNESIDNFIKEYVIK